MGNLAFNGVLAFADAAEETSGSLFGLLLPLILIGGIFYFMMILPQRRRMKAVSQMRDAVRIGDEVRTIGGIYGIIVSIDDDEVVLDAGGGTHLRLLKRAVAERLTKDIDPDVS